MPRLLFADSAKADLLFYKPFDDGVHVLRVLHHARDIQNLLIRGDE
jgi:plasmid stabilization system protein ParE